MNVLHFSLFRSLKSQVCGYPTFSFWASVSFSVSIAFHAGSFCSAMSLLHWIILLWLEIEASVLRVLYLVLITEVWQPACLAGPDAILYQCSMLCCHMLRTRVFPWWFLGEHDQNIILYIFTRDRIINQLCMCMCVCLCIWLRRYLRQLYMSRIKQSIVCGNVEDEPSDSVC